MRYNFVLDQKFWTLFVDVVSGLILYFVGKYASASIFDDVKTFWLAIQPLIALVIAGMFQADSAALQAGKSVRHLVK
jgi:hypothetical protein